MVTKVWVHNKNMAGRPQTTLFISAIAKVVVVVVLCGLHCDQSKESSIVWTTSTEGQFFGRISGQYLTSIAAQTNTVMHDL